MLSNSVHSGRKRCVLFDTSLLFIQMDIINFKFVNCANTIQEHAGQLESKQEYFLSYIEEAVM